MFCKDTSFYQLVYAVLEKRTIREGPTVCGTLSFRIQKCRRGLAEALLEVGADGLDELGAVDGLSLNTFHQVHEVL